MDQDVAITLEEARDIFYARNGFPTDGGINQDRWSPIGCRDLKVYLPNFGWRKKALPYHDLHHIVTGYAFSPTGEFEISAWEFAAGRYPNLFTTLFCIPLVGLGALTVPRRTFAAFVRGRNSRTLYNGFDYSNLLSRTVGDVRNEILPKHEVTPTTNDYFAFASLVGRSVVVIMTPLVGLFLLFGGLW